MRERERERERLTMRREATGHQRGEEVDQIAMHLSIVRLQIGDLFNIHSTHVPQPQVTQLLGQPKHLQTVLRISTVTPCT